MGTNYIAPTWRMPENTNKDKLSNYSLSFDGATREDIQLGTTTFLLPGQPSSTSTSISNPKFSASIFFNFNSSVAGTTVYMIGAGQAGGATYWYLRKDSNDNLQASFRITNGAYATITGGTTLSHSTWYHACVTWDGDNINLYLNGVSDATQVAATTFYYSSTISHPTIGSFRYSASATSNEWEGKLSQVCVFDYDLSVEQITYLQNLNNPMAISGSKPIAYYPLGDNSNPTANAGYPNISVGADSVFDFNSSFIDPGSVDLGVNGSVAMWFSPEVGSVTDYVLLGEGSQGFDYVIRRQSGAFYIWIGGTFYNFAIANDIVDGSWNFLVVTKSAGDVNVYLKNPSGEFSDSHTNAGWTSASFKFDRIGGRTINPINLPFNGEISNFQAWDTPLTNTEITTLYNNGQPIMTGTQPQAANLQVWYKLNQSSNWEADSTGNWQIPDATSSFPQSFNFIASQSDAINFGPANGLGFDSQISISAWFNQTPGGGNLQQLVAEDKTGSERNWGIILVGRVPNFQFFDEAGVQVQLVGTALPEGQWHHILCTATGDTSTNGVKMYINGQLVAQGTASNENIKNDNIQAKIGTQTAPTSTYYFDGKISNVAVWNTDQSSEKDNIYNSGTPATSYTNMPQYWYKLDNTSIWNPAPANYWSFPNSGELTNYGIFNFSN